MSTIPPTFHTDTSRVPIWRDAPAPLGKVVNYRVVWAALALVVGIDGISVAFSNGRDLGVLRVVLPAALCAVCTAFALWQLWLVVVAARRTLREAGSSALARLTFAGAVIAAVAIAGILREKVLPQLEEMWDIQQGDARLSDLNIVVTPDQRTMFSMAPSASMQRPRSNPRSTCFPPCARSSSPVRAAVSDRPTTSPA